MAHTIDIDTGGTFTDGFFTRGDRFESVKVDTTPHDLTVCFMECIGEGAEKLGFNDIKGLLQDTNVVRFSTTIGTNTFLQRTGTKIGLIVTRGFEDNLYGDDAKNPLFNAIISEDMIVGINEEIGADGEVVTPIDHEEVRSLVKQLLEKGARMIVVSLRRSNINLAHEREIRDIINRDYPRHYLGSVPLLLSSQVSIRPGPGLRTNTASINAYLHHSLSKSLYKADEIIRDSDYTKPLLIAHSTGGVARVAKTTAIHTYNSGPVAGLYGSLEMAKMYDIKNVITIDIGGTSTDVGLICGGMFDIDLPSKVEGIAVDLPMIRIGVLGAGGGSIARVDSRNQIRVGPQSAGAMPGPACYELGGTDPTLTDSYVALGYLDPEYFMGGNKSLDRESALDAINEKIAAPLGKDIYDAAFEVKEFVKKIIGDKVKQLITEKGLSPDDFVMFAFGGGGGCLCCDVAEYAGILRIYVFPQSPVFCAFGSSVMDIHHMYEDARRVVIKAASGEYPADFDEYNRTVADLQEKSFRDMRGEGFKPEDIQFSLEMEINAGSNGETVIVEYPNLFLHSNQDVSDLRNRCLAKLSDKRAADGELSIVFLRLKAKCATPHNTLKPFPAEDENPQKAIKGKRSVCWTKGRIETDVYDRSLLKSGNIVYGPAIIEAEDTTFVIPEGRKYLVDQYTNGIIQEA